MKDSFCSFEKYDLENITPEFIQKIYEIEKDSIGYFYKSLKICNHPNKEGTKCGKIYDKEAVFGHIPGFEKLTVVELEEIHGSTFITPCCKSDSEDYRNNSQIDTITSRLSSQVSNTLENDDNSPIDSYCVTVKNATNEIVGICYGNINKLEALYKEELKFHFTSDTIKHEIFDQYTPDQLYITICGVFIFQKYMLNDRIGINAVIKLLGLFANTVDDKYIDAVGIFEAKVGTATHNLNRRMGGTFLELYNNIHKYYTKPTFQTSDICIHPGATKAYRSLSK